MGACQCITSTSDSVDLKMNVVNSRIYKLKQSLEAEDRVDEEEGNKLSPCTPKKNKKSNSSYIFDYKEHAMFIFEMFNLFRKKPQKYFKKMIKNGYWNETDTDITKWLSKKNLKWSDDIYNTLYIRDGIEDIDVINKIVTETINYQCECLVYRIDGDYDPEMSILMLLQQYPDDIDTLLSDKYNLGTVNSYNDPDRIFFYIIKKFT
jgi:hypothetical protein